MENNSVLEYKKYGKVVLNLQKLISDRNLTKYKVAKLANVRYEVIKKWCTGTVEKMDLDVLARICYVLKCSIEDVMYYDESISEVELEQE